MTNGPRLIEISGILQELFPEAQAGYIYGSCGTLNERPESDIDLAVLMPHDFHPSVVSERHLTLMDLLGHDCDLINLRRVPTTTQVQVIRPNRRLFCRLPMEADSFEDFVLWSYAKLNEERKEVLQAIFTRGSIYA